MPNKRIRVGEESRDFTLTNTKGEPVSLSDYEGKMNIYLVFNRGFT